eukprot:scaffold14.g1189.t1
MGPIVLCRQSADPAATAATAASARTPSARPPPLPEPAPAPPRRHLLLSAGAAALAGLSAPLRSIGAAELTPFQQGKTYLPPWEAPLGSPAQVAADFEAALLAVERGARLVDSGSVGDREYRRWRVPDTLFDHDDIEVVFSKREGEEAPLVSIRSMAAEVKYIWPITQPITDFGSQRKRLQLRKAAFYYIRFCVLFGLVPRMLAPDEELFMFYCYWLSKSCSASTISNYLHGVRVMFLLGMGHPFVDIPRLRLLRRGLRRLTGAPPRKKRPITPAMLLQWAVLIDPCCPRQVALFTCMLVAFFGFFRKSTVAVATGSLADERLHLRRADVSVDINAYCLRARIPRSKTNPFGERPDVVCIQGLLGSPLDPVSWYRMVAMSPAGPQAAAFGFNTGQGHAPITHAAFVAATKTLASRIMMDPREVAGHSCRRAGRRSPFMPGCQTP